MNTRPRIHSYAYAAKYPYRVNVFKEDFQWEVWRGLTALGRFSTHAAAIAHATTYTKQNRLISHNPN